MTLSVNLSRTEALEELTGSYQSQCVAFLEGMEQGDGSIGKMLTVQHSGPKCDPQNSRKRAQIAASDPALGSRSLGFAG